ncbi:hypothetical protein BGZ76_001931 [Entomortierella beljakovae]|nr:hypothetical protein BGZ76_001931 [Entomortierella beljakovae]
MTTILVSFLQARVQESISTPGNDKTPFQIADGVLERFGLKLNVPYQPSGIAFLQSNLNRIKECRFDIVKVNPDIFSTMTVDYSRVNTVMWWHDVESPGLLGLRNSPSYLTRDHTYVDNNDEVSYDEDNSGEDNSDEDSSDEDNSDETTICESTIKMLVHYNHQYITEFTIWVDQIQELLPFASKFACLIRLNLWIAAESIANSDVVVSFIKQNNSSFPMKKSLEVVFEDNWLDQFKDVTFDDDWDHATFISEIQLTRGKMSEIAEQMMSIILATKPSKLKVDAIPSFYKLAEDLETDQLIQSRLQSISTF